MGNKNTADSNLKKENRIFEDHTTMQNDDLQENCLSTYVVCLMGVTMFFMLIIIIYLTTKVIKMKLSLNSFQLERLDKENNVQVQRIGNSKQETIKLDETLNDTIQPVNLKRHIPIIINDKCGCVCEIHSSLKVMDVSEPNTPLVANVSTLDKTSKMKKEMGVRLPYMNHEEMKQICNDVLNKKSNTETSDDSLKCVSILQQHGELKKSTLNKNVNVLPSPPVLTDAYDVPPQRHRLSDPKDRNIEKESSDTYECPSSNKKVVIEDSESLYLMPLYTNNQTYINANEM